MYKQIREVRVIDLIRYNVIPLTFLGVLWGGAVILAHCMDIPSYVFFLSAAGLSFFFLKKLLIGFVLLYKAFAPMSLRNRCRFEPCCSTYMIMSLQKYGLFVGSYKGVKRICRCRPPYGGIDEP